MSDNDKKSKSKFDTGNWSPVNGLPGKLDIINYLEFLLASNPNQCYTRRQLMDSVAKEFEIPTVAQEAEGPKSDKAGFYTRVTYLITDAIQGKRKSDGNQFAKRVAFNVYQHITGNGIVPKELLVQTRALPKFSKREVESARVSVRLLRNLTDPKWQDPAMIFIEMSGRSWSDDVLEAAINKEFNL